MLLLILSDILPLPLDPLGPPGQIHALVRFRGKSDGDDANDGGGSVADRGFMTRGLLAVPYSEAAISREALGRFARAQEKPSDRVPPTTIFLLGSWSWL